MLDNRHLITLTNAHNIVDKFISGAKVWNDFISDYPEANIHFHVKNLDHFLPKGNIFDFSEYKFPLKGNVKFSGINFGNIKVDFSGAIFGEGNILFNNCQFGDKDILFLNTNFGNGIVTFENAKFGNGNIYFIDAKFGNGNIYFTSCNFGDGDVSFYGAQFKEGDIIFHKAIFGDGDVSFNNISTGNSNAYFDNMQFGSGNVSFNNITFGSGVTTFSRTFFGKGNVIFYNANFGEGIVSFDRTQFSEGKVIFDHAYFGDGDTYFRTTSFDENYISFKKVNFGSGSFSFKDSIFSNCEFVFNDAVFSEGFVDFSDIEFSSNKINPIHFQNISFSERGANFSRSNFGHSKIYFDYSDFKGHVSFVNLTNSNEILSLSFKHCIFHKSLNLESNKFNFVPDLTNTSLNNQLSIQGFMCKPSPTDDGVPKAIDAIRFCRLKELAEANKSHQQALIFHIQEMRIKRFYINKGRRFLDLIFDKTCHYGNSISIPSKILLGMTGVFWFIYFCISRLTICKNLEYLECAKIFDIPEFVGNSLLFTITQTILFMSAGNKIADETAKSLFLIDNKGDIPHFIYGIGVIQGVISFILLFLIGLGLRHRFRL
ncbi:DUF4097 domain-containing protein [Aliamphritea ceti]|uniref:DUF4097 domain-containing protein n=1 Tax=Aliamphritea ceti TaxID=1524258 RepID=UPI0021C28ECC|nr:DUF4097 domain-containing protein [Aliamphritea ceti]